MAAIVPETVYTKTAKGILEARNKSAKLPKELAPVFQAIDGKATVGEILPRLGLTSPQLHQALDTLAAEGYIKAVASSVHLGALPAPAADVVDFPAGTGVPQLNMELASHALAETEANKQAQQAARTALDARLRAEAEARARALAEIRMQAEAEARAKAEAAARAAADARAEAEREASVASDAAARAAAENRARTAAGAAVRAEAEARARSEAESRARALVDEKKAAEARAREEAQMHERNQSDAQARAAGEARARQTVEARLQVLATAPHALDAAGASGSSAALQAAPEAAPSSPPEIQISPVHDTASTAATADTPRPAPPPELDLGNLAQQLTARVHAERRARDQAGRKSREVVASPAETDQEGNSVAFPTLQLAPAEVTAPPAAPASEANAAADTDLPTISVAQNSGAGDVRHVTPDHVPSALERAMMQTAARAEAEQRKQQEKAPEKPPAAKKQTAAEASAAKTAPHIVNLKQPAATPTPASAPGASEPSLVEDEPVHERLNVDRTAHDIMAETAEARRRAEADELKRSAAAIRRQRAEQEARRTDKIARVQNRKQGARAATYALIAIPAAAVAFLQFVPLNTYIPDAQQALSERLNQPTTISTLRYVLLPSPRLVLEGVRIGSGQDVRVDRVDAYAWPTTLMSEPKVFDQVDVAGVTIDQAMLAAIPSWTGGRTASAVHVARLKLSEVKLSIPDSPLEGLSGDVTFEPNGTIKQATLNNEKLEIELTPRQSGLRVLLNARDWRAPFGPAVPFSFLSIDGVADKQHFATTALSGRIGGGAFTGTLAARWEGPLIVGGEFKLQGTKIDEVIDVAAPDLNMRGTLSASGRYALQSDSASGVLGRPVLEATFSITRGELSNIDLPRAMQGSRSLRGGRTAFDELSGSLQVNGKQFSYRQLELSSGPLNARGNVDVSPTRQLSGRVDAEFAARGSVVARSAFRVAGTVKEPQLVR